MRTLISLLLLLAFSAASAQKDPVAKNVLDKFSDAALSAPAVTMEFTLKILDKVEGTTQESDGRVVISNNMYMLELPDNIMWYDGSSIWNLSPEVKEVTVTLPEAGDDTFITSPSSLFDMYKGDFKYSLLEELPRGSLIDLYPEDPSASDFTLIRLVINSQNALVSAEYRRKDGIDLLVDIHSYDLTRSYPDGFFVFNPDTYPDVDIIDMR